MPFPHFMEEQFHYINLKLKGLRVRRMLLLLFGLGEIVVYKLSEIKKIKDFIISNFSF